MGLKKYEIITVGSDRRVRALRSWQVGDRYVNIGDTGGIVYDEKTLSQEGACWLFRGNFGFPGARIGGDSIVDVGEATLSATGAPNVDILGSSVLVGSKLRFESRQTAANAVVLTGADFEQGGFGHSNPIGTDWERWKVNSPNYVRTIKPIFAGGAPITLRLDVPGYRINWFTLDRDGNVIATGGDITSGGGITTVVPACHSFVFRLAKDPIAAIVPADATAAQITFTGTFETKLSIIDSRVEINPATSTGTLSLRPGGTYTMTPGAKYPDSVIQNSKVSMMVHATADRLITLMAEFINTSAVISASVELAPVIIGIYKNVKNLAFSGSVTGDASVSSRGVIQATDCNDFAVSSMVFRGLAAAQTANMPFIFQGCNVPDGRFQHHAQIANTYKNIDFAKAQADLGKAIASGPLLVSSEVEGMYRIHWSVLGAMVEAYDSVKSLSVQGGVAGSYGTTIYKDAYLNGLFDIAGTNVFGNKVRSHPLAQVLNVQPRAVQGGFTLTAGQPPVPSTESTRVRTEKYFRLSGAKGISVQNMPAGLEGRLVYLDGLGNYTGLGDWYTGTVVVPTVSLTNSYAYILFRKTGDAAITPEDLAGVTVTVYNGCKIVNTGATAINMKGNIRVEDNATLVNASVTGTGYFGSNSVTYYNPAVWAALECTGSAFMKDNAVFAPTSLAGACAVVHMEGNAKFIGSGARVSTELSFIMRDNAIIEGVSNTRSAVVMSGNAKVTSTGVIAAASRGVLVMEDNASIEAATTVIGAITLAGNYKGNVVKTWTGKRTITDVNAPEYDNNVKTQYEHEHDF